MNQQARQAVYQATAKIPVGSVMTYGDIARQCGLKTPRTVGYYLHHNPDPRNIPCHRVVDSQGKCAKNFAFGMCEVQERLLKEEGVAFLGDKVDLARHRIKINHS